MATDSAGFTPFRHEGKNRRADVWLRYTDPSAAGYHASVQCSLGEKARIDRHRCAGQWRKVATDSSLIALALALALALATSAGCGAGDVVIAEGARATSCVALEEAVVQAYERGELSRDAARAKVDCIRTTCDMLHAHITEDHSGAETD